MLPALEVADLSFNIYMEAALSLEPLVEHDGLPSLRRLDLRWARLGTRLPPCHPPCIVRLAGLQCRALAHCVFASVSTQLGKAGCVPLGRACSVLAGAGCVGCRAAAAPAAALVARPPPHRHSPYAARCRKMLGVWKQSSIRWLQELVEALHVRHEAFGGSLDSAPVVQWD